MKKFKVSYQLVTRSGSEIICTQPDFVGTWAVKADSLGEAAKLAVASAATFHFLNVEDILVLWVNVTIHE